MNLLELKLYLEDNLLEVKKLSSKYKLASYEIVGVINNKMTTEKPTPELHKKADLVFETFKIGKHPTGASFVVIKLKRQPNYSTSWESLIKQLDEATNNAPLNASVIYMLEDKLVILASMTIACVSNNKNTNRGRLLIEFISQEHPGFMFAMMDSMKEFGLD